MLGTQRCDSCWELERRVEQQPLIALRIALQVLNQRHAKIMVEKLRTQTRQLQALVTAAQAQEPAVAAFWGKIAALPPDARAEFDRLTMPWARVGEVENG